ncbi:MAG: sulfurtransferase-like selenium metabolism protein YedF [Chloroflexi bacterium]|nr:sulfurtransferase-like selenium metabolism protein YedF [Chloroflexota bacterium]
MKVVDARNLDCPQPVILAKQALAETDEITVIVDNEVARENVSRLGESEGCAVSIEARDGEVYLTLKRTAPRSATEERRVTDGIVLFIASDILGRGENLALGSLLMQSFLHTLGSLQTRPETIIFINNGVKLVTRDSPVLGELQQLAGQGMEIIACGTCLSRLELTDKVAVGQVSNMYVIAETLLKAEKIVSL